jgi:hypothetical protein
MNKKKNVQTPIVTKNSDSDEEDDSEVIPSGNKSSKFEGLDYANTMSREEFLENLDVIRRTMKEKPIDRTIPRINPGAIRKLEGD